MSGNHVKILIADDDAYVSRVLARWISSENYECTTVASADEAWELLQYEDYALLISDIMMPGMSGMQLLSEISEKKPETAVIMVTGVDDRQTALEAMEQGAFGYIIKPFEKNEVLINVTGALRRRELELMQRNYQQQLEAEVRERTAEIRRTQEEITLRLVSASSFRDEETGAHIKRMGLYASRLAEAAGWAAAQVEDMRLAAPMHDVGKIGVPDRILRKPGRLTEEEFEEVEKHTLIGAAILEGSGNPLVTLAREIALTHHEKWDGSGYPGGLAGEAIPLSGRMVAVCDVYDALSTDRVYRKALSEEVTLEIMRKGRGSHFDPEIFDLFLGLLDDFRSIRSAVVDEDALRNPRPPHLR